MSRQMERILFGFCTARQCESLFLFALSEGSSEAGGIVNRNGKVLQVLRLPFQNQSEPPGECEASGKYVAVHDLAGICHYRQCDWLRHLPGQAIPSSRGGITLQQFPVIKAR